MPIPDYQACMLPLLEALADGQDRHLRAVTTALADRFGLTDAERTEQLPSGQQTVISNRVAWAKTYLKKAGLVVQPGGAGLLALAHRRAPCFALVLIVSVRWTRPRRRTWGVPAANEPVWRQAGPRAPLPSRLPNGRGGECPSVHP